jgi:hypothetical protein
LLIEFFWRFFFCCWAVEKVLGLFDLLIELLKIWEAHWTLLDFSISIFKLDWKKPEPKSINETILNQYV